MPKHESKTDFLHKISKDFVCIFSNIRFLVKLESNEKADNRKYLLVRTVQEQRAFVVVLTIAVLGRVKGDNNN